uniref:putative serine protease 45 n=1 Tax=Jaculus jaculus TaxID=51337 RepID=UPI001E1B52BD|nr:putative serine protease 45 [Jaculus jaculus]
MPMVVWTPIISSNLRHSLAVFVMRLSETPRQVATCGPHGFLAERPGRCAPSLGPDLLCAGGASEPGGLAPPPSAPSPGPCSETFLVSFPVTAAFGSTAIAPDLTLPCHTNIAGLPGQGSMPLVPVCGKPWWPENLEEARHWPWEVSLRTDKEHVCGGALIAPSWVVSAAHCIHGTEEYSVMLGTNELQPLDPRGAVWVAVSDIIVHPRHWGWTFPIGDVALLHLHTPVTFSKYVQPICLPEPNLNLKVGTECWVTGWGQAKRRFSANTTLLPELREAQVFIMDNKRCNRLYHKPSPHLRIASLILGDIVCATNYGENLCYGDAGSPLACEVEGRWILVGILSWEKACARPQNPGVYTRLAKYSRWIKKQVSHGVPSEPCSSFWLPFLSWVLHSPMGP